MSRLISVLRRRANLLEFTLRPKFFTVTYRNTTEYNERVEGDNSSLTPAITIPVVDPADGIKSYNILASTTFNGSYTSILSVKRHGYYTNNVVNPSVYDGQLRNLTKVVIDPDEYSGVIADSAPFWLKAVAIDSNGDTVTTSGAHLILPFSSIPNRAYNISGTVGSVATELQLPGLSSNMHFLVTGTNNLFLSFEDNGQEFIIPGIGNTNGTDISSTFPSFNSVIIRGSGAGTAFYASFRLVNSPAI